MSFSSDLKMELSKINNLKNKKEVYFELLGYIVSANMEFSNKNMEFSTENEYNINRFTKILNNLNIIDYKIKFIGKTYVVTVKRENLDFIKIDKLKTSLNSKNVEHIDFLQTEFQDEQFIKSYIRGTFLGAGSLNNPKNKYHLEILFRDERYALQTQKLLCDKYEINIKKLEKTIYLKDGEEISRILALIGANSTVLKFEEIRVLREMKNNVNRIVNCETANLNKTINTAVMQTQMIKNLKKSGKYNNLPSNLKEIADLRLQNPEATLEELGQLLKKPIGKSSVSHRFKKIEEYL